ncbi:helix-turn-helix domain-containing protein [Thalassospira xianhensis]|jgi:transcriptional regulator with XRE-family HTH domain|nr:helix-turn-helix transcriptional regulator [Thalassospira xianhensis]
MIIRNIDDIREAARSLRKQRGLTQSQTAALIGYSRKWLSSFERGSSTPPIDMIIRLFVLLGSPLSLTDLQTTTTPNDLSGVIDIDEGL